MLNDKEVFSFELNELLYFNKGQEIVEMVGISLNPEISIQPFNDYVSIRGVIELKGEYLKSPLDSEEEDQVDLEDYHFRRYLEKTEEIDDDRAIFSHRFPVEISVPSYRVDNIDDITVSIETFDYSIPSNNELKLTSTIDIHGINEHIEEEEEIREVSKVETLTEEPFEFEIKQENEESEEEMVETVLETAEENKEDIQRDENVITHSKLSEEQEEPEGTERWKYKESQTLSEFFEEKTSKKEKAEKETEEVSEVQEITELKEEESTETMKQDLHVSEEKHSHSKEESEKKDLATVEDVSYLSDMFRGDGEEEPSAQMRVRIVQQDDTIESIAETYNLSVLQILNKNGLENDHIEEGQLLNIPQK